MLLGRSSVLVLVALALPLAAAACRNANAEDAPALSKTTNAEEKTAAPAYAGSSSPGIVPCGPVTCPASKSSRRVCCNAPGVPPMCRNAERCGQATKFRYSGMLGCNETADCPHGNVCCLSDDGFRADGVAGPYDRATCVPKTACLGPDVVACLSDSDCAPGKHCKQVQMGVGIEVGGCL